jgi:host factor-I protein
VFLEELRDLQEPLQILDRGHYFRPIRQVGVIEQDRRSAMDSKPAQNIQDTFLNTVRKDKSPITIYLVSGVKLTGKIRSFDKYSVLLENNAQEQLIFKHAISTVVSGRPAMHEVRPASESRGSSATAAEPGSGSAATTH